MKRTLKLLRAALTTALAMHALQAEVFDKDLSLYGIDFHIYSKNDSSLSKVTITPKGLKGRNKTITVKADGTVSSAEIGDLNHDGAPEIYIYTTSSGSGSYGGLIAYSSNHNLSLSPIYLPPLDKDKVNGVGYMGHDSFKLEKDLLLRSFPLYKKEDSNAAPQGGSKVLKYTLIPGEASWILKIEK